MEQSFLVFRENSAILPLAADPSKQEPAGKDRSKDSNRVGEGSTKEAGPDIPPTDSKGSSALEDDTAN